MSWQPTQAYGPKDHAAVLAEFGWRAEDDAASYQALHQHVPTPAPMPDVAGSAVTVLGCAPSLLDWRPSETPRFVIAADGATTFSLERGVVPAMVFTDLDGEPAALEAAATAGSHMVVHAHGDNAARVETARAWPRVSITAPGPGVGFTDGDRAALWLAGAGAKRAHLVGFDRTASPSPYSHHFDAGIKAAKLAWMGRILDRIANGSPMEITGSW